MTKIVCTCGQDMIFNFFEKEKKGSRAVVSRLRKDAKGKPLQVKIGGGAGVLVQSGGVVKRYETTNVPDDIVELLHTSDAYKRMKLRGFFTEYKDGDDVVMTKRGTPEDMEKRDQCAQIDDHDGDASFADELRGLVIDFASVLRKGLAVAVHKGFNLV